jgi:hypothetical protein
VLAHELLDRREPHWMKKRTPGPPQPGVDRLLGDLVVEARSSILPAVQLPP